MGDKQTCNQCGALVDSGANFCSHCANPLTRKVVCPYCKTEVEHTKFCSKCGRDLRATPAEPKIRDTIWARGEEDFAISVSKQMIDQDFEGTVVIRHGSKAVFIEEGRVVEIAESGRYTTQEGGFINTLLNKSRDLSAVLVDAGDVELHFDIADLRTKDELFVDIGINVVLRLEDPNAFFVNVMKERKAFKIYELRSMLFGEIQNALQEATGKHDFNALNTDLGTKNELASRMETHLRQTFGRSGFGFGQVRSITISQKALDETARRTAEAEIEARKVEAEARGTRRVGEAEITAEDVERDLRRHRVPGAREDVDIEIAEKDVDLYRKERISEKEIEERFLEAGFIEKRLEVYKRLKETDVDKIKTDEDFRKFKLEVDREQVLDEAEWKGFQDEILWKEEDRHRDRRFLVSKIELQQDYDIKRLDVRNRTDVSLEEKKAELELLEFEQKRKLQLELERVEHSGKVEEARARGKNLVADIEELGKNEREINIAIKELGLEKDKAETREKIAETELRIKEKKSELGLANLEKLKAIKRKDEHERMLARLDLEQKNLEMRLKEEDAVLQRELERMRAQSEVERDRIATLAGLSIEQLIAVSEHNQAKILGDLAQSQALRGMNADEIMAMQDPVAFGKALEERARNTQSEELKGIYERMLEQTQTSMEKVAQAHRESSDRAERMHGDSVRAMSGQQETRIEAERQAADRVERFSERTMDRMSDVATARAGAPQRPESVGDGLKVQVCGNCKREVSADKNFCPNCGSKLY